MLIYNNQYLDSDAGRTDLNWSAVAVLVDHTEPDTNILRGLQRYFFSLFSSIYVLVDHTDLVTNAL